MTPTETLKSSTLALLSTQAADLLRAMGSQAAHSYDLAKLSELINPFDG